jgi:hypothetical protein
MDTSTALGARDAQWLGVLARVGRRGVRSCRTPGRRSRWMTDADFIWTFGQIRARCAGMRLRATDGDGDAGGDSHFTLITRAVRAPGQRGVVFHLARRGF